MQFVFFAKPGAVSSDDIKLLDKHLCFGLVCPKDMVAEVLWFVARCKFTKLNQAVMFFL